MSLIYHVFQESMKEELKETYLAKLDIENRKHLCNAAQKYTPRLYFRDHYVAEAQLYEFEYTSGETETSVAIPCPTLPQLYVSRGNSDKEVKLVLLQSFIDDYEFEVENVNPISASPCKSTFYQLLRPVEYVSL